MCEETVEHFSRQSKSSSLAELARCRPRRGSGAPARTLSHKQNILRLLRDRGAQGVLGSELYAQRHLYGRSPRNRISELRQEGALIEGKPHGTADWFYRLIRDADGSPSAPIETDYMRRAQEEHDRVMPLFAGVGP